MSVIPEMSSQGAPVIKPARRRTLPEAIVQQLAELIAGGGFPDERLPPERILCEQLEVSRASLREALSALGHLGIVETRGKSKYGRIAPARAHLASRVSSEDSEQKLIADPLEVRRILEPEIAARAAVRATDEALDEIERWLQLMERATDDRDRVVEYDSAFHVAVARATGNHTLVELIGTLVDVLRESRRLSFVPPDGASRSIQDHHSILNALRAKDSDEARHAMKRHLDQVESLIRESVHEETFWPRQNVRTSIGS
jgi:DNA-binding FadR family transcriptional regulator